MRDGIKLLRLFEAYVRRILRNIEGYSNLMEIAVEEVKDEIVANYNDTAKANEMIRVLSKDISALPAGFLEEVKGLESNDLFRKLRSIYIKDNLKYFIFNHHENEFIFSDIFEENEQRADKKKKEIIDKSLWEKAKNESIEVRLFELFGDGKNNKIALPRAYGTQFCGHKQAVLNELYLMNIAELLNKTQNSRGEWGYQTIYLREAGVVKRYDIFDQGSNPSIPREDQFSIINGTMIEKEQVFDMIFDKANFQELKEMLCVSVWNNRCRSATRSECEEEILNMIFLHHWNEIKDYKAFVNLLQEIEIEEYRNFLSWEIGDIKRLMLFK